MTNAPSRALGPLVFEQLCDVSREDGGASLVLSYATDIETDPEIRIVGWSEDRDHPFLERLLSSRVRITVEILSDASADPRGPELRSRPEAMTLDEIASEMELIAARMAADAAVDGGRSRAETTRDRNRLATLRVQLTKRTGPHS